MIRGSLAKRYARALMAIGREQGNYERLGKEIDFLAELAATDETMRLAINTPVLSIDARASMIEEICKAMDADDVTRKFLKLLNDKGRLGQLEQIALAYRDLTDIAEGRVRAEVQAATALSSDAESKVRDALAKITGKTVLMNVEVDESLIGGIVARVSGKLYDGSVRAQLDMLEEKLKATGEA